MNAPPITTATDAVVILCTLPQDIDAQKFARELLANRLCACVTCLPNSTSLFMWNDSVESNSETQLIIKSAAHCVTDLINRITTLHPYSVPEVLAVSVVGGLGAYIDWIRSTCLPPTSQESD